MSPLTLILKALSCAAFSCRTDSADKLCIFFCADTEDVKSCLLEQALFFKATEQVNVVYRFWRVSLSADFELRAIQVNVYTLQGCHLMSLCQVPCALVSNPLQHHTRHWLSCLQIVLSSRMVSSLLPPAQANSGTKSWLKGRDSFLMAITQRKGVN